MACTKELVFQEKLLEKCVFHCQNDWSTQWSSRSVLTLGKRPKEASLKVIAYCQFNQFNHCNYIFIFIILHKAKHTI